MVRYVYTDIDTCNVQWELIIIMDQETATRFRLRNWKQLGCNYTVCDDVHR
jgi:hypothetical protein